MIDGDETGLGLAGVTPAEPVTDPHKMSQTTHTPRLGEQSKNLLGDPGGIDSEEGGALEMLIYKYAHGRVVKGELTKGSAKTVRACLLSFAKSARVTPDKIARRHVDKWLATDGLSPSYRRSRFSALRGFFTWCVLNGHMPKDLTLGFKTPKVMMGLPRALPIEDARAIAAAGKDSRTRLIVSFMEQEGLRRGEVSRAMYHDIDHRKLTFSVRGKGGGGEVTRVLPISDETKVALARYLSDHEVTGGRLIRSHRDPHQGIGPETVSELVRVAMREAGVKQYNGDGCTPHALRHTMAQDMLDNGAEIRQVQKALGHASMKTTEWYLRNQVGGLREAMAGRTYASLPSVNPR